MFPSRTGEPKCNEYRKIIHPLPCSAALTACSLPPGRKCSKTAAENAHQTGTVRDRLLREASQKQFYNPSRLLFERLLDDPNLLRQNRGTYIRGLSKNVRDIIDRFGTSSSNKSNAKDSATPTPTTTGCASCTTPHDTLSHTRRNQPPALRNAKIQYLETVGVATCRRSR